MQTVSKVLKNLRTEKEIGSGRQTCEDEIQTISFVHIHHFAGCAPSVSTGEI